MNNLHARVVNYSILVIKLLFYPVSLLFYPTAMGQLSTVREGGRVVSTPLRKDSLNLNLSTSITETVQQKENATSEKMCLPKNEVPFPRLSYPLRSLQPTSPFGSRFHPVLKKHRFHSGVDLKARYEGVYAFAAGVVEKTGYDKLSGLFVTINHGQEITTTYAHLSYIGVVVGEVVKGGRLIALSGSTGRSTAPHLHFSIRYQNTPLDPMQVFKRL